MPQESIVAIGIVTAVFGLFGFVLAYAEWATRHPHAARARR